MKAYAQLNDQMICVAVSELSGEVTAENMIPVPVSDPDYLWRRCEGGVWSNEKHVEEDPAIGPSQEKRMLELEAENASLKARLSITEDAVLELAAIIGGA